MHSTKVGLLAEAGQIQVTVVDSPKLTVMASTTGSKPVVVMAAFIMRIVAASEASDKPATVASVASDIAVTVASVVSDMVAAVAFAVVAGIVVEVMA